MPVPSISERDFTERVLRSKDPVLLACRASWCVPSQQLAPVIEKVASDFHGRINVFGVDFDKETPISRHLGLKRVPVTMLVSDGKVVDFIGGVTDERNIAEMVARRLEPVLEVGEHNFDLEVLRSSLPVLVHFHSAACKQSLQLVPEVRTIAERFRHRVKVVQVEFGPQISRLRSAYQIVRVPTIALFAGGVLQDQIFGAMVGGTKGGGVKASCVGLTTVDNLTQMLSPFLL